MRGISRLTDIARSESDPRIQRTGPTSLTASDQIARGLGWFSLALGVVELMAPGTLTRALGLQGKETLVRAYGAREMMAGISTLSMDKPVGLASRIAGDLVDIATLLPALNRHNPKRGNAILALIAVGAVTVVDCIAFAGTANDRSRNRGQVRDYSHRSGLPRGVEASRGLAREQSAAMRAAA
jgi:hypothetical protein